jgi:hypothetical protein
MCGGDVLPCILTKELVFIDAYPWQMSHQTISTYLLTYKYSFLSHLTDT